MTKLFTKSAIIGSALFFGLNLSANAQSPLNGFMQGKKGGGITFSLAHEHYQKIYLVPEIVEETPVFKSVSTNSFNIYGTYGISDKLDIIMNLPYIQTIGNANKQTLEGLGYTNTISGYQDIAAYLKYQFKKIGDISLQGAFGITTPVSNYNVDQDFQSLIAIGNKATTFNGFVLAHFIDERGFFITGQAGYSFRTTEVPNAILSELKIGFSRDRFYLAGQVSNQTSTGGVDILRPGFTGFFPATKVNYTKVGGTIYAPIDGNIGLSVQGGTTVGGRNIGKSYYGAAGLTYNFKYKALTK